MREEVARVALDWAMFIKFLEEVLGSQLGV
jgi:hypothetical protein